MASDSRSLLIAHHLNSRNAHAAVSAAAASAPLRLYAWLNGTGSSISGSTLRGLEDLYEVVAAVAPMLDVVPLAAPAGWSSQAIADMGAHERFDTVYAVPEDEQLTQDLMHAIKINRGDDASCPPNLKVLAATPHQVMTAAVSHLFSHHTPPHAVILNNLTFLAIIVLSDA